MLGLKHIFSFLMVLQIAGAYSQVDTVRFYFGQNNGTLYTASKGQFFLSFNEVLANDTIFKGVDSTLYSGVLINREDCFTPKFKKGIDSSFLLLKSFEIVAYYTEYVYEIENGVISSCSICGYNCAIDKTCGCVVGQWKETERTIIPNETKEVRMRYYENGQLRDSMIIEDGAATFAQYYFEDGKPNRFGSYNALGEHGLWVDYKCMNEFPVYEFWKNGILVDVQNDDVIFIGKKNKLLDKASFFELIRKRKSSGWNIKCIPKDVENETSYHYIMYSEQISSDLDNPKIILKILNKSKKRK